MHTDPYYLFNDIIEGDYVTDGEAFTDYEELVSILQSWRSEGKIRELKFDDPNQVLNTHCIWFHMNLNATGEEYLIFKQELETILPTIQDIVFYPEGEVGLSKKIYKAK